MVNKIMKFITVHHSKPKLGSSFFNLANGLHFQPSSAILAFLFAPLAYSTLVNTIVSKPLVLVNAGWCLELAQLPL